MQPQQLEKIRTWYDNYIAAFYGDDEYVNANLKLKEDHSRRVCDEMQYLAGQLGLDDSQKRIGQAIALLHDVGRFKQFVWYRTYNDTRSLDHNRLALEVLADEKILDGLGEKQKQLIEKAIEYHGVKKLPDDLDGDCLLFCQLIRDADKLDIFFVVIENYRKYRDNQQQFMLELEFPEQPSCSEQVIEDTLAGQRVDYSRLQTMNDMRLLQLGWVYDVNFAATLKRIKQRRYLEKILEFLPKTEDVQKVSKKVLDYLENRIKNLI